MKLYSWKDKHRLQHHVWAYTERREQLRKRFNISNGMKAPEKYHRKVKNLNYKINYWTKCMNQIDKKRNQVIAIGNYVAYFTGINVKGTVSNQNPRWKEARGLFYKYCLENGISATFVAEYVGACRGDIVARGRINFTKKFSTNPEVKQRWLTFKKYIEERKENIN